MLFDLSFLQEIGKGIPDLDCRSRADILLSEKMLGVNLNCTHHLDDYVL